MHVVLAMESIIKSTIFYYTASVLSCKKFRKFELSDIEALTSLEITCHDNWRIVVPGNNVESKIEF